MSETTTSPAGAGGEADDDAGGWLGFGTRKREPRDRRTRTSTTGDGPTVAELATAIAGALAVVAGFAAWIVGRGDRYELRTPHDDEKDRVAQPLARILDRRIGTAFLVPDLVDGVAAAAGVAAYIETGPLFRKYADPQTDPAGDPDLAAHGYERP